MCYRVLGEIIGDECAPATVRIAAIRLVLTLAGAQEAAQRASAPENIGKKAAQVEAAKSVCEGSVDWGDALRSRVKRDP
jgi:hypothetical protein